MTRRAVGAAVALVLVAPACGAKRLDEAQWRKAAAEACAQAQRQAGGSASTLSGDAVGRVVAAHGGALRRIRALEVADEARAVRGGALEKLEEQQAALGRLQRAVSAGAPAPRVDALAGAVDVQGRLLTGVPELRACTRIVDPLVAAAAAAGYAHAMRAFVRRAHRLYNPRTLRFPGRDPGVLLDRLGAVYEIDGYAVEKPPEGFAELRARHRAYMDAFFRVEGALMRAETRLETSGVPFERVRRALDDARAGLTPLERARRRLLEALRQY